MDTNENSRTPGEQNPKKTAPRMSASDVGGRPRRPWKREKRLRRSTRQRQPPPPESALPNLLQSGRSGLRGHPAQPSLESRRLKAPHSAGRLLRGPAQMARAPGPRSPGRPRSPSDAGRLQRRRPGIPATSPTARPTRSGKPSGPQISKPSFLLRILYSSGMKRSATARTALQRIPILPSSARSAGRRMRKSAAESRMCSILLP